MHVFGSFLINFYPFDRLLWQYYRFLIILVLFLRGMLVMHCLYLNNSLMLMFPLSDLCLPLTRLAPLIRYTDHYAICGCS